MVRGIVIGVLVRRLEYPVFPSVRLRSAPSSSPVLRALSIPTRTTHIPSPAERRVFHKHQKGEVRTPSSTPSVAWWRVLLCPTRLVQHLLLAKAPGTQKRSDLGYNTVSLIRYNRN